MIEIIVQIALSLAPLLSPDNNKVRKYYYDNGNLMYETPYKQGVEKHYYTNSNMKAEIPYSDDAIEGVKKNYYENGRLFSQALYKNDRIEGVASFYDERGGLLMEVSFEDGYAVGFQCKNGKKEGKFYAQMWRDYPSLCK